MVLPAPPNGRPAVQIGNPVEPLLDDQWGSYLGYHRSGIAKTSGGGTQRESVLTEVRDLSKPWPFTAPTIEKYRQVSESKRLRSPTPWFLDNGPLTPPGFGIEFPAVFKPRPGLDPPGTDIYVAKAMKYPYAPDTYLAFPSVYFHYYKDGPWPRRLLAAPVRNRGLGVVETQLATSRDGVHWRRFPRPTYIGMENREDRHIHQAYIAYGMVRRGNEIWQYYYGTEDYHTSWKENKKKRGVYRVVQKVDRFVSVESPYDRCGTLVTKPLTFKGNRLLLNIDTDAAGYTQVGFLDENGDPVEGFDVEDCIYINGDFMDTEVEWIDKGKDLSELEGKPVQLVFRMRGSRLYSMRFTKQ